MKCCKCKQEKAGGFYITSGGYRSKKLGTVYRSRVFKCYDCNREEVQKKRYRKLPYGKLLDAITKLNRLLKWAEQIERLRR